ncbi:hypothetical protein LT493_25410 [Streptomyces tricolor]|nr:hypothetical protein [Streptomyces tricolor]
MQCGQVRQRFRMPKRRVSQQDDVSERGKAGQQGQVGCAAHFAGKLREGRQLGEDGQVLDSNLIHNQVSDLSRATARSWAECVSSTQCPSPNGSPAITRSA